MTDRPTDGEDADIHHLRLGDAESGLVDATADWCPVRSRTCDHLCFVHCVTIFADIGDERRRVLLIHHDAGFLATACLPLLRLVAGDARLVRPLLFLDDSMTPTIDFPLEGTNFRFEESDARVVGCLRALVARLRVLDACAVDIDDERAEHDAQTEHCGSDELVHFFAPP